MTAMALRASEETLQEALAKFEGAAQSVVRNEGVPISEAVDRLLETWSFAPAALHHLLRVGAIDYLNTRSHKANGTDGAWTPVSTARPKVRQVTPTGHDLLSQVLVPFEAIGARKTLLECTDPDLIACDAYASKHTIAWRRRRDCFRGTRRLLREHGVSTVAELPPDALAQVLSWAEGAWA